MFLLLLLLLRGDGQVDVGRGGDHVCGRGRPPQAPGLGAGGPVWPGAAAAAAAAVRAAHAGDDGGAESAEALRPVLQGAPRGGLHPLQDGRLPPAEDRGGILLRGL